MMHCAGFVQAEQAFTALSVQHTLKPHAPSQPALPPYNTATPQPQILATFGPVVGGRDKS